MSDELAEIIEEQKRKFQEEHGREIGPNDKLFFDAPPLEHVEHYMVEAMKKAGLDPAIIYAFEKTGLLVTEENEHLLPEKDLAEWEAAIDEYEAHQEERGRTARGRRERVVLGGGAVCQQEILGLDQLLNHDLTTGEMLKGVS